MYDELALHEDTLELPVQINGKLRGKVAVPSLSDENSVRSAVIADERLSPYLQGKNIIKFIYVPKKIVNIVVAEGNK